MTGCEWPHPWTFDEVMGVLAKVRRFGVNPSLNPITALCEALGRPQDAFRVVQVTGTNGKTSTARISAALLQAHGRRSGLYTSPELERYPERLEVDGSVATDAQFAQAVGVAIDTARALWGDCEPGIPEGVTEFELLTAAALWHFRERGVDTAVLEVGMGGRWDATSVAVPAVAVITGVGLDHTDILGDTLELIAAEKAAIIRPGSVAIMGPGTTGLEEVFRVAIRDAGVDGWAVREVGSSTLWTEERTLRYRILSRPASPEGVTRMEVTGAEGRYADLAIRAPAYQAANVATAVAAVEPALGRALDAASCQRALAEVSLPGRFELMGMSPPVVVDGSHNPQACAALAASIAEAWPDTEKRPLIVVGVLADKDARGIIEALAPVGGAFAVIEPDSPRALGVARLATIVYEVTGVHPETFDSVGQACAAIRRLGRDEPGAVVTGSVVTAGQARRALRDASVTE